ncbi:MAG: flagellar basal body protein [Cycloclasticus sp.]|jgi:Flagellar basal body protein
MDILASPVNSIAHGMLDALSAQQKLLAKNIANANVDGYRPSYMNFDQVLSELKAKQDLGVNGNLIMGAYVDSKSGNVQLDMELLQMQETVLQYKTLLDALSRKGALMKTVMGGGR